VENSIIYPGVVIEEKAVIRDSIVLPFVRIGQGARITRCVVDESTDGIADA
jgi:glucose-1-phosphate adenylyltransferase